jgi:dihydropteroate synthase
MGVRPAGVLRLGRGRFEPWQLLVMAVVPGPAAEGGQTSMGSDPAVAMEWVHSAVVQGADIVEVPGVPSVAPFAAPFAAPFVAPFVATVRDAYPELVIAVRTERDDVAREACAAGADLLCGSLTGVPPGVGVAGSPAVVARAVEAGVAAERVIVEGSGPVADLVASGWPVLVSLSDSDLAGDLARAAVFGWLGARVFRVFPMLPVFPAFPAFPVLPALPMLPVGRVRETRRALSMVSAIRGDSPPAYAVRGLA